jgi:hypothetical protein
MAGTGEKLRLRAPRIKHFFPGNTHFLAPSRDCLDPNTTYPLPARMPYRAWHDTPCGGGGPQITLPGSLRRVNGFCRALSTGVFRSRRPDDKRKGTTTGSSRRDRWPDSCRTVVSACRRIALSGLKTRENLPKTPFASAGEVALQTAPEEHETSVSLSVVGSLRRQSTAQSNGIEQPPREHASRTERSRPKRVRSRSPFSASNSDLCPFPRRKRPGDPPAGMQADDGSNGFVQSSVFPTGPRPSERSKDSGRHLPASPVQAQGSVDLRRP